MFLFLKDIVTLYITPFKRLSQITIKKFNYLKNNGASTWNLINSVLHGKKYATEYKLSVDDEIVTEPLNLSESFNKHFATIANNIADTIPKVDIDPLSYVPRVLNTFAWFDITDKEVNTIIKKFKSKQSPLNTVPNFVYKHCSNVISPILAKLINVSIRCGVFP